MAIARFMVDKSVFARQTKQPVAQRLIPLAERGLLAICGMVEAEMLFSVRNLREGDQLIDWLANFERLSIPDTVYSRVTEVQRELIRDSLHRTVKIPDLVIAATAERHGVTMLHYDHDFDRIAKVTGQPTEWVVPPGEAD
ncbi:PIN domain nuclease [Glycomyces sp. A-F 0318]|uniref:PIN domain nuclease n=1 Tax=Glycomyces amatae TaxID=2881355 RepID=UPI001E567838|nr:PIN domain nuclease [Glycomyces amatae]MCD0443874.1 PIN domain nuclease [Glycomyces amatae]